MRRIAAALLLLLTAGVRAQDLVPPADPSTVPSAVPSTGEEPIHIDEQIMLELRQTRDIPVPGLQYFIIMDPAVADVTRSEDGQRIFVRGLSIGSTYLHVWSFGGRRTFQIQVSSYFPSLHKTGPGAEQFSIQQSLDGNVQDNRTPSSRTRDSFYNYYLQGDGPTALGKTRVNLRANDQDHGSRVTWFSSDVANRFGGFRAGDISTELSLLTLPFAGFQGAEYKSPADRTVRLQAVGGNVVNRFWGPSLVSQADPKAGDFTGVRLSIKPLRPLEVFAAGAKTLTAGVVPGEGRNEGGGFEWRDDHVLARAEGARSPNGDAWYGDAGLLDPHGSFTVSRRDVDENYVTASGGAWDRGQKGVSEELSLRSLGPLHTLTARHDDYLNRYLPNPTDAHAGNRESRATADLEWQDVKVLQDVISRDFNGLQLPFQLTYAKTEVSHPGRVWQPFVSFRREYAFFPSSPLQAYSDVAAGEGVRWRPSPDFSAGLSSEVVGSRQLATGEKKSALLGDGSLRWGFPSGARPLKLLTTVDYQELLPRFSDKVRELSWEERMEYNPSPDMRLYASGRLDKNLAAGPARNITALLGVSYHSWMGMGGLARAIEGCVFLDLNGDGFREPDEPGLPGMRVTLDGSGSHTTDEKGCYRFRPHRGTLSVSLDPAQLPDQQRLSSSNPQIFQSSSDDPRTLRADFGVMYKGEISGDVQLDLDDDGLPTDQDKPVPRTKLSLDGKVSEVTDSQGRYHFAGVSPGDHTVELDVLTLPADILTVTSSQQTVTLAQGEKKEARFLLKPMRFISGKVFWDKNGNGKLDPGEPGVEGIHVRVGSLESVTDNTGAYYITGMKAGDVNLFVSQVSLGKAWALSDPLSKKFTVRADVPFIKENIDFPLRKKR